MLSISKGTLAQLPAATYGGRCHIIDTHAAARDAALFLLKCPTIGFDTETRPSFQRGRTHKVALLQFATHEECFLFRVNKTGIGKELKQLIETPDIIKIGLSTSDDFNALRRLVPDINPDGFLDLQKWVKNFQILDNSLSRIHGIIFGERISKAQRLTNWEADVLSAQQQQYAALDAWACLKIYDYLKAGLFNPELSPYIIEPIETISATNNETNS